jgi:hypothetical protein
VEDDEDASQDEEEEAEDTPEGDEAPASPGAWVDARIRRPANRRKMPAPAHSIPWTMIPPATKAKRGKKT